MEGVRDVLTASKSGCSSLLAEWLMPSSFFFLRTPSSKLPSPWRTSREWCFAFFALHVSRWTDMMCYRGHVQKLVPIISNCGRLTVDPNYICSYVIQALARTISVQVSGPFFLIKNNSVLKGEKKIGNKKVSLFFIWTKNRGQLPIWFICLE